MTYEEAEDLILGQLAIALTGIQIVWPDTPSQTQVPTADQWARCHCKFITRSQRGFSSSTKKFTAAGLLTAEIYSRQGDGRLAALRTANGVVTYLENNALSQVWYRNIRAVDTAKEGSYAHVNVLADFLFDDHH